jgi:polyisoprenoid-binding protein YceI
MTTANIRQGIPAGAWTADQVHSNASFEVEHAGLSTFRGALKPIDAKLVTVDGEPQLEGAVEVATISVDDEDIRPHLLSPEFFDVERNPEIRFRSTEISGEPDDLRIAGELTLAGVSRPVEARGRLRGPASVPGGGEKLALELEAVIDRTDFGMNWQLEFPNGGKALANEVKLAVALELNKE